MSAGLPLPEARRGAALFIVLVLCALLAGLAGTAMRTGLSGARAATAFADAARADALGQSAADIVIHQLVVGKAENRRGGSLSVTLPDARIDIDYVSESARIDVNAAPVGLIGALLSAAGADPLLVGTIVERIRSFRGRSSSTAAAQKASAVPTAPDTPSTAPARPMAHLSSSSEVERAWGLPRDLAKRVLPYLSVAGRSEGVDPILASRLVIVALMGKDDEHVDDYLERRSQGFVNADSALALLPTASRAYADFQDVAAVRAVAEVAVSHRFKRRYEMVIAQPDGQPNQRPVVVEWRRL